MRAAFFSAFRSSRWLKLSPFSAELIFLLLLTAVGVLPGTEVSTCGFFDKGELDRWCLVSIESPREDATGLSARVDDEAVGCIKWALSGEPATLLRRSFLLGLGVRDREVLTGD